jgi:hypothetical protein
MAYEDGGGGRGRGARTGGMRRRGPTRGHTLAMMGKETAATMELAGAEARGRAGAAWHQQDYRGVRRGRGGRGRSRLWGAHDSYGG